jgi:hypothetical protein
MTADDINMDDTRAEGGSDGTGLLYVSLEVFGDSSTVTAIAPVGIKVIPPGPTCTANCGHKYYSFCNGPCLTDYGMVSSSSFIDPEDPNAPLVSKCWRPGCLNRKCTDSGLCIERGCTGGDCKNRYVLEMTVFP